MKLLAAQAVHFLLQATPTTEPDETEEMDRRRPQLRKSKSWANGLAASPPPVPKLAIPIRPQLKAGRVEPVQDPGTQGMDCNILQQSVIPSVTPCRSMSHLSPLQEPVVISDDPAGDSSPKPQEISQMASAHVLLETLLSERQDRPKRSMLPSWMRHLIDKASPLCVLLL